MTLNWTSAIMWIVTGLYAAQSGVYLWTKNYPQALMLFGYAFANVGLIASIK